MIWISQQLKTMYPGFSSPLRRRRGAPWTKTFAHRCWPPGPSITRRPEYYDGPNLATQSYVVPNVDQWSTLLGAGKVVVGFGVWDQPNYMTIAQAVSTWRRRAGQPPRHRRRVRLEIDVDQSTGWPFATQVGPLVHP